MKGTWDEYDAFKVHGGCYAIEKPDYPRPGLVAPPDDAPAMCPDCGTYALDISPSDAVCRCGKPLFSNETRIANLERLVKRIAAHLGIDG